MLSHRPARHSAQPVSMAHYATDEMPKGHNPSVRADRLRAKLIKIREITKYIYDNLLFFRKKTGYIHIIRCETCPANLFPCFLGIKDALLSTSGSRASVFKAGCFFFKANSQLWALALRAVYPAWLPFLSDVSPQTADTTTIASMSTVAKFVNIITFFLSLI